MNCTGCSAELSSIECLYCGTINKSRKQYLKLKMISLLEGPKNIKPILELPPPPRSITGYGHGMVWF